MVRIIASLLVVLSLSTHLRAQDALAEEARSLALADPFDQGTPPTPPHTGIHALLHNVVEDITKLPAMQNVYILSVGGGLALAVHPADQTFNGKLGGRWNKFFAPGKYVGDTPEQV